MTDTATTIIYRTTGVEGFDVVRPLWEKLRAYHARLPWRFAKEMPRFTFEPRKQEILTKSAGGKLLIELAGLDEVEIAYCISTITAEGRGEVDSIFVEESYRGRDVGSELLHRALAWLVKHHASPRVVSVADGNKGVLALYRRFGFYPRTICLQQDAATPSD